ncbi:MaoC family dehydratase [Streptomyces sp. NPDC001156]
MTNVLRVPVPQDLLAVSGRALGPTPWVTVTQHEVNQFAEATGDFQWVHTDAARAKDGPFGSTIAHGYLTLALAGRFVPQLIMVEKCSGIINYGCDRVRFPTAVPVPSRLRGTGTVAEACEIAGGVQVTLHLRIELEGTERPACVITSLLRYLN